MFSRSLFLSMIALSACAGAPTSEAERSKSDAPPLDEALGDTPRAAASPSPNRRVSAELLRSKAVQTVMAQTGSAAEDWQISSEASASFPLLGTQGRAFKLFNHRLRRSGQVVLDENGSALDGPALEEQERIEHARRYGKLDPVLFEHLNTAAERVPVVIWVTQPAASGDAAQVQSLANQATAPIVRRMLDAADHARADSLLPFITASLSAERIKQIAGWPEVLHVDLNTPAPQKDMSTAYTATTGATTLQNLGYTGNGVKVAIVETQYEAMYPFVVTNQFSTPAVVYSAKFPTNMSPSQHEKSQHATEVAGIIRSANGSVRGIAPYAALMVDFQNSYSRGSLDAAESLDFNSVINWGASVINFSHGSVLDGTIAETGKVLDTLTLNYRRTFVCASGNTVVSDPNPYVGSPASAYNTIAVSAFDDKGTTAWSDDTMGIFADPVDPNPAEQGISSYKNPKSGHSDREKPELSAPGVNITTTNYGTGFVSDSGTSFAAPMVTGGAALLMQKDARLKTNPEAVKAILMSSAWHNIEGAARLSDQDGAGGLSLTDALDEITSNRWTSQYVNQSTVLPDQTVGVSAGKTVRIALTWSTDPTYWNYTNEPSTDLDLYVYAPNGSQIATSTSYDNTYEIVQFTAPVSGTYTIHSAKYRMSTSFTYAAVAYSVK